MIVKVTKQAIEGAYWWLTYTGEHCTDIEDLYQAVQIMVTETKSNTTSYGGYSGSSSSIFDEGSHSGSTWGKSSTTVDCSYIEVDFKLAAKIHKLCNLYRNTTGVRWNASIFKELRRNRQLLDFKSLLGAGGLSESFSQIGLANVIRNIKQNIPPPDPTYATLVWYVDLMKEFCTFDYTNVEEDHKSMSPERAYRYNWYVLHKYSAIEVMITYEYEVYSVHINICTRADVGKKRVFECVSLDACKKVIKETAFKLMPLLLSDGWGSGQILVENEIEGLYV
jgi:hypothetical protein